MTWSMREFEADDALAAGAARYGADPAVERVLLCTPDKDLAQCVEGQRIIGVDRRRKKTLDAAGVREKFGVEPASIPDWLALVGDSADGIPGIPRWGARSSATVLARYGQLEKIPPLARDWDVSVRGADTLAQNLEAQRDDALLYRRLATLRRDVPLEEPLAELEWRGAHREELHALCAELGETELLERVPRWR